MKFRNVIFWMHLVCGVLVGTVILIMSVTGTMLAFEPQIVAFFERDVRSVDTPQKNQRLELETLKARAFESKPGAKPVGVTIKSDVQSSVVINFGKEGVIYINPYTGQVLGGESKMHEFMHRVEVWHRWLGMEGELKPIGHNIKGACNLAFLGLIATGFYLWWPQSWSWPGIKNIIMFNPKAAGKARDWNWHNVIGFWCAPFLIVISLTGAIMSYEWATSLLYRMSGNQPPVRKTENVRPSKSVGDDKKEGLMPQESLASLDTFFVQAQLQEPNWETITIRLGQKTGAPVTVMIKEKGSPYPAPQSTLTLDASTAEVKKWEPLAQENLGRRLRVLVRYLHTGQVAGFWGQLIAFTAAMGATFLVWTGLALAWNRFCSWRQRVRAQPINRSY